MAKKGKKSSLTVDHRTELHFELDAQKIAAIKKCLAKGKLSIVLTKVNLTLGGRAQNGYAYD
jgi:hypothetical protein